MSPERLTDIIRLMSEATRDHQPLLVDSDTWVEIVTELLVELGARDGQGPASPQEGRATDC